MMSSTTLVEITAALLAVGVFSWLEWRRTDGSHLFTRLVATILAVIALALLGLRPTWKRAIPPSTNLHATLWTSFSSPVGDAPNPAAGPRFALPNAVRLDPVAQPIPDAAFLRRHFPTLETLQILGDGLDPAELDALRGLRVEFAPPQPARSTVPGVGFLLCPRELRLGDPLVIQGQLRGLPPGTRTRVTLEAPDGAATHADTDPADASGNARFALRAASLPATGHFLWRLRVPGATADLSLGVAVIPPELPRLLVLESAPRFDTAALRRWFGTAGGTLVARTEIGQDRYQYTAAAATPPPPFPALDAALLAGCDLVLADTHALLVLPPAERAALLAAVTDTGLGVLILPDDALSLPPTGANDPLLPWKLSALATDPPGADRPARVQWPGQSVPTDLPIPTAPFEIAAPGDAGRVLISDHQGHTLTATDARGRGQIALTLVRDTTRWQRENDPAAFAAYWSFLFSRLARPTGAAEAGKWSLADGDAGPVFVDHPLTLLWAGPVTPSPPGPAAVASPPGTDPPTALALAPDPTVPGRWRGTFWPRRAGWHRVALASGGPALDFYVDTADAWPTLVAARRRTATARFAEASADALATPAVLPAAREEFPPFWFAALFFVSAGYLWVERRFTH